VIGPLGVEDDTLNATPLLAVPPTVTVTLPDLAPDGTAATMRVALQLLAAAAVPLNRTTLEPCVAPKFEPLMVTAVPTGPEVGDKLVMVGADATSVTVHVNVLLLVNDPSETVAVTVQLPELVDDSVPVINPVLELTLREDGNPDALYVSDVPSGSLPESCTETLEPSALV
jgi:hypothetical protein